MEGKLCLWHFGELGNPKISFPMFTQPAGNNEEKAKSVSTMEFPEEETDKFYFGSEDYHIYQSNLHKSNNSRDSQSQAMRTFAGH